MMNKHEYYKSASIAIIVYFICFLLFTMESTIAHFIALMVMSVFIAYLCFFVKKVIGDYQQKKAEQKAKQQEEYELKLRKEEEEKKRLQILAAEERARTAEELARKKAEKEKQEQEYLARRKAEWEYKNLKDQTYGFTKEFFDYVQGYTLSVADMYKKLLNNAKFMEAVDRIVPDRFGTPKDKFELMLRADIIKCYDNMGHDSSNLKTREGVPVLLLEHYIAGKGFEYSDLQTIHQTKTSYEVETKYKKIKHAVEFVDFTTIDDHAFLVREVLNGIKTYKEAQDYCRKLLWFFVAISKADANVTYKEDKYLDHMEAGSDALVSHGINEVTKFFEQLRL